MGKDKEKKEKKKNKAAEAARAEALLAEAVKERKAAEAAKEEQRRAVAALRAEEEKARKRRAEEARRAEEERKAAEARRAEEEKRKAEEAQRAEEEKWKAEEALRVEEEKRRAEEALRAESEKLGTEERLSSAESEDARKAGETGAVKVKDSRKIAGSPEESTAEVSANPDQANSNRKTQVRTQKEIRDLTNRLSRVEGQIRGIKRMVEEGSYCPDILVQVAAANAALNSFSKVLLAEHIRNRVTEDIREGKDETVDELVTTLQKLMK